MSLTFMWDDEMTTGIEKVDEQHKDFLELGRKAEELLKKKMDISEGEVTELYALISDFLEKHFAYEESIMEKIKYKRITPHKEAHRGMLQTVRSVDLSKVKEDPMMPVIEMRNLIQETVWNHIYENDKDFGREYRRYQKLFKHLDDAKEEERARNEKKFGMIIKEDNMTISYLMWDQTYRGNAVLVNKEKRASIMKLSTLEYNTFMRDLSNLIKAVQKVFTPDDIEIAVLGDVDQQLCVHVVPKYKDHEEYGKIFSVHEDFERWPREDYQKLAAEIAANIVN